MIACAKWLGRTSETCTRKPDGCICEKEEIKKQCICSDGPFHYITCPMYEKDKKNPFEIFGEQMSKRKE